MSKPERQHPVAAITKALDVLRGNFITILLIIFIGGGDEDTFLLYWIVGMVVLLLIWGVLSWLRFTFELNEGELKIEQGVFVRKKLYLTSDRIQVIDISAGVIQRMFGLVAVEVKTAGSSSKEAKISALSREKAELLKSKLRQAVNGEKEVVEHEDSEEQKQKVYSLTTRDLLVAASTSGRMGVALSIVGAAFSQIDQFISDEEIYQFIEANMPQSTSASLVVMSIIGILVISWLFSFITTLITYYDFSVEVRKNELLISRGLFERIQLTIPFNRIQAVQVKEGLMRQPFGYVNLVIESAGYGEKEGNSTVLFPLINKGKMHGFLKEVLPEYNYEVMQQGTVPPKRALRRYLIRTLWWSLPIILIAWVAIPYGVYTWFLLPLGLLLGFQQYRDAGICTEGDTLIISARQLSKKTAIVKRYRMQATQLKQNPFQKRMSLRDFIVHVASGNQGRSFSVRDIAVQDANRYWQWLAIERQSQPEMQDAPFDQPDAEISSEDQ